MVKHAGLITCGKIKVKKYIYIYIYIYIYFNSPHWKLWTIKVTKTNGSLCSSCSKYGLPLCEFDPGFLCTRCPKESVQSLSQRATSTIVDLHHSVLHLWSRRSPLCQSFGKCCPLVFKGDSGNTHTPLAFIMFLLQLLNLNKEETKISLQTEL